MTNVTWLKIIYHLFVLCGIRKMNQEQHEAYLICMFNELKSKFDNETIGIAARQIAEKENLYGSYPPLSMWIKYSPALKIKELEQKQLKSEYLADLNYLMTCDPLIFNFNEFKDYFISHFGWHGYNSLKFSGLKLSYIREIGLISDYNKSQLLNQLSHGWDNTNNDNNNFLLLENNKKINQIENK